MAGDICAIPILTGARTCRHFHSISKRAISAQYLNNVKWAEDYTPDAKAGHSIFIYNLRKKRL